MFFSPSALFFARLVLGIGILPLLHREPPRLWPMLLTPATGGGEEEAIKSSDPRTRIRGKPDVEMPEVNEKILEHAEPGSR